MELDKLSSLGDFGKLNNTAVSSVLLYLQSIDITDATIPDLNTLGKVLVRLIRRARAATTNRDDWDEVITSSFVLSHDMIEALNDAVDDASFRDKAATLAWLRDLSDLSEGEAEVDAKERPEIEISPEEVRDLLGQA